jgi:hypothetical protein
VLRASAICERAGVPAVSLVCQGFMTQAATTAIGLGMPNLCYAMVPGHIDIQTKAELRDNLTAVTVDQVVAGLTRQPETAIQEREVSPREIVFAGSFTEVNEHFYDREWSDGLPIIPPTVARVESFLRFTDRNPEEVLGILLPDSRAATIWSVAVAGVMAGCRPEYMPILVALAEAMADPEYGVEHSGNTPGSETVILLNGPIIKELGFNFEQGAMRDGFQANTAIGRFWRLYLRNIAGFLLHKTDKGTFGNTWRVVLAENEEALAEIGWQPHCVDMGFAAGENVVTIGRYTGGNLMSGVGGSTPEEMLPYIADAVVRQITWQVVFTIGLANGMLRPLVLLTPIIARQIAKAGWSKHDVKRYLFEHARMPAAHFNRYLNFGDWVIPGPWNIEDHVRMRKAPAFFYESDDPNRLVPIVFEPEDFLIAVTGDVLRTNAYALAPNGNLGFPVAKRIDLPKKWRSLLAAARLQKRRL